VQSGVRLKIQKEGLLKELIRWSQCWTVRRLLKYWRLLKEKKGCLKNSSDEINAGVKAGSWRKIGATGATGDHWSFYGRYRTSSRD
jgi:hypothetical protein